MKDRSRGVCLSLKSVCVSALKRMNYFYRPWRTFINICSIEISAILVSFEETGLLPYQEVMLSLSLQELKTNPTTVTLYSKRAFFLVSDLPIFIST